MPSRKRRVFYVIGVIVSEIVLSALVLWCGAFLLFCGLPMIVSAPLALLFVCGCPAAFFLVKPRGRALAIVLCVIAIVFCIWGARHPSNNREWQPDVARLSYATFNGDLVTVHNIRNNEYRSPTDYTVRYYDKTFDLRQLRSIDLFVSNWGLKNVSHTIVSFGFPNDQYLCISIETRMEKGEAYSTFRGFFRQFEIIYVVADERDLVRLRTNFRHENVYLYRIQGLPYETRRAIFLDYFRTINSLRERPQWYNALTDNCTTGIRTHTKGNPARVQWDWRILLNGRIDELLYENGVLDRSMPFPELKKRSLIDEKAQAADDDLAFSRLIREGLPGMSQAGDGAAASEH